MTLHQQQTRPTEVEEMKIALRDMISLSNKIGLRLIVMEAAIAEVISAMPGRSRQSFATTFRSRIARLMQVHANRLLPFDDAEITRAMADILGAARFDAPESPQTGSDR